MSGTSWDGIAGTDQALARALAEEFHVLWADPPASALRRLRRRATSVTSGYSSIGPNLDRLHVVAPPGVTRPVLRSIAGGLLRRRLEKYAADHHVVAAILTDPEARFPRLQATKIYYVTDDWSAGADLLGLDRLAR